MKNLLKNKLTHLTHVLSVLAITFLLQSTENLAQSLNVTLTPSDYNGYHVSCFGNDDASITCNVTGGTSPYIYI